MKDRWPHDIVRLLQNWARWVVSGGIGSDRSPYPAYNLAAPGPRAGNIIPTLNGEAEDADHIIASLPYRYQHPLRMNYIWPNTADRVNAKRCSCCLNTYKTRLDEAHTLFAQAWYARGNRCGVAGAGVNLASPSQFITHA